MDPAATGQRQATVALALACALVVAAALRTFGVMYGLPAVYNPDEVAIMNRAIGFAKGDPNPHNFVYPTLYFYLLFVWEGAAFVAGWATGVFDSLAAFERSFFVDPTYVYTAGRLLTVVFGVLTVAATYACAARLVNRTAGLVAAALLTVAPLAVRDAHYVKHDVPVTLLIVLTHAVLARTVMRTRDWAIAGGLAGLAMSMHYYAVFLAVPVALAAVVRADTGAAPRRVSAGAVRGAATAGVFAVAALVVTSPFLLADPAVTIRDMVANREIVMDRATDAQGMLGSGGFYLRWLAREAFGAGGALLAFAGLLVLPREGWRTAALVLAFPITFLLFISNTYPASRYLNAIMPFMAILGGIAVARMMRHDGWRRSAAVALVALATIEAGVASVRTDMFFRQTDTRSLALAWIERHVPPGASVLVEPYSVPVRMSREALAEALAVHLGSADRASIKFQRILALEPFPEPAYRAIYLGTGGLDVDRLWIAPAAFDEARSLAPLRALAVTHVIRKRYNGGEPSRAAFDAALEREGRRLALFSPHVAHLGAEERHMVAPFLHNTDATLDRRLERPGPTIEIWTIAE